MTVGTRHSLVLKKLSRLAAAIERTGCHLALQAPIRIPPGHEPEPDASIVRGKPEDYSDRHPEPKDVVSVIEVSESSLVRDQTTKLRVYAEAGIKQ